MSDDDDILPQVIKPLTYDEIFDLLDAYAFANGCSNDEITIKIHPIDIDYVNLVIYDTRFFDRNGSGGMKVLYEVKQPKSLIDIIDNAMANFEELKNKDENKALVVIKN